jgi:SAM-dependent methyltransferase
MIPAGMLEVTGERLLPDQQRGELVHAEHLARYRFASRLAEGKHVLDAACGEGYGTAMLAAAGAVEAIGVDLDADTVAHAKQRYALDFRVGDVCALPFEDASFDLVVSFETIEHVADAGRALAEMRRALKPDGVLVISTPNSNEYLIESGFHQRDFRPGELGELLAQHFDEVTFLYQQNWLLSAVMGEKSFGSADGATALDVDLAKVEGLEPGKELYTIAVCGNAAAPLPDVAVATGVFEAHRLAQQLNVWTERAHEAERLVDSWLERAEEAERLVRAWSERATEAERQAEEARATLERIESSVSWKLTSPFRSAKQLALRRRS